jgi:predicted P-loop ATPase/DNA polymerase I-like protein with 3'-5' exonuclease and polymerase domains
MMAPSSTQSANQTPLQVAVLAALAEHGPGRWPAGVAEAVAERAGSTKASVQSTKSRLAKGWQPHRPELHVVPDPEPQPPEPVSCVPVTQADDLDMAAAAPGGNGHSQQQLELVAAVLPEPAPEPIPADPAAERLAEIQQQDATGLALEQELGRKPTASECRQAGLPLAWSRRLPKIRDLSPEALLELQQQEAAEHAALVAEIAAGVDQAAAAKAALQSLTPEDRAYLQGRAGGAYTDLILDWLVDRGFLRSITWEEVRDKWKFTRAAATKTGGLLICHNPQAKRPHYQLRCAVPPVDEERGRAAKYLMQTGGGQHLAVWDPSGLIGPDGERIGQAKTGTEGFFDAAYSTLVLGIPCMAITAPSHLRVLELPQHLRTYLGDCDQWMAPDLLPTLVHGCVSKSLKLARLPLVEAHRAAYLGRHKDLPGEAKGGMEELGVALGLEGARAAVETLVSTAEQPGEYLAWEIGELKALGLRWPEHSASINNLISAMADAHPDNAPKQAALKDTIVAAFPPLGAKVVNDGIRARLERRRRADMEERQRRREQDKADALARGERVAPEIDREDPSPRQLQEWLAYAHTVRFNVLRGVPELDGNPITDLGLTYQLLSQQHDIRAKKHEASDALLFVAKSNSYNPVTEYLQRLRADQALEPLALAEVASLFGVRPGDALSAALLQRSLAGTALRGLEPGCKFDQAPVLYGPQGNGKTEILRALAGPAWFDQIGDQNAKAGFSLSGWKVMEKANSCWIFELGEGDRLTIGACQSALKDWISARNARFAEKNEKLAADHLRGFVPWVTTNKETMLNDPTGARRFWIIHTLGRIGWPEVEAAPLLRDRVWKAALCWLDEGVELFLPKGSQLEQEATARAMGATLEHPWVSLLVAYLEAVVWAHGQRQPAERERLAQTGQWETVQPPGDAVRVLRLRYKRAGGGGRHGSGLQLFVTSEDLYEAVGVPKAQWSRALMAQVGDCMRHSRVTCLGWERVKSKRLGWGFALQLDEDGGQPLEGAPGGDPAGLGSTDPLGSTGGCGTENALPAGGLASVPQLSLKVERDKGTHTCSTLIPETHTQVLLLNIPDPRGTVEPSPKPSAAAGPGYHEGAVEPRNAPAAPPALTGLDLNSSAAGGVENQPSKSKIKPAPVKKRAAAVKDQPPALPPVVAPVPQPYEGPALPGIDYIHRAQDLPDPEGMPLLLGFDLETWNRRTDIWRHKASLFPFLGGEIRLAQVGDGHQTLVIDVALLGEAAIDWLRVLARNPERTLVGHNLLFEATHLIAAGIRPLCRWWDTMLASQTIGDYPEHNLAAAAKHYLGQELDKALQTGGELGWGNRLTAEHLRYAAIDAQVVLPLRDALARELEASGQTEVHRLDCLRVSPAADGQERGLGVDVELLGQIEAAAVADWEPKRTELHDRLGLPNPPADDEQPYRTSGVLHPAMVTALGGETLEEKKRNNKTGEYEWRPSCSRKVLDKFRGVPVVDLLLEVRDLDKTLQEVAQLRRDVEYAGGRTRPDYKLLGANTGRITTSGQLGPKDLGGFLSDTEVYGPTAKKNAPGSPKPGKVPSQIGGNFQGLTKRTKHALVTGDPDTVLVDLDWTGQEIRLQASPLLYNDSGARREVFLGEDSHSRMAHVLFDLAMPPEGVVRKLVGCTPAQRDAAKPANFSLPYGCGPGSLRRALSAAQGTEVSWDKAQAVYDAWHQFHPETSRQMDRYDPKKPGGGNIYECRSLGGRRVCYRGKAPRPDGTLPTFPINRTNGANWPIQSSGADMLSAALGDLWPALDAYPGTRVIGLVHDELLLEAPRAYAEEVKAVALAAMTSDSLRERFYGDVPLEAEAKVADSWGAAH